METEVENFKIENLSDNEIFITTVMHATQVAIRNHQREKLEALRNAVISSALGVHVDQDMQQMFLEFIDGLTPSPLRVLSFLDDPRAIFQNKSGKSHSESKRLQQGFSREVNHR